MLFDNKGKFIKQIGNRSRGPGEYQYVVESGILNDSILAIQSLHDLIYYRINGTFINEEKNFFRFNESNDEYLRSWIIINDSLFFGHLPNTTGLIDNKALILNRERIIKRAFKIKFYFKEKNQLPVPLKTSHIFIHLRKKYFIKSFIMIRCLSLIMN